MGTNSDWKRIKLKYQLSLKINNIATKIMVGKIKPASRATKHFQEFLAFA